jgi:hypothetical protein
MSEIKPCIESWDEICKTITDSRFVGSHKLHPSYVQHVREGARIMYDAMIARENHRAVDPESLAHKKAVERIREIVNSSGLSDYSKFARIDEAIMKMQIEIDAIVRGKGET